MSHDEPKREAVDVHHHFHLPPGALSAFRLHNRMLERIMANITEVRAAVAKIQGDVSNVQRVLGEVNTQNTAMAAQIVALQEQIAAGTPATEADLQEIVDTLAVADAALDSLAPDAPDQPIVT